MGYIKLTVILIFILSSSAFSRTLLFYHGGFRSCKDGFPPESVTAYDRFVKDLVERYDMKLVLGCFKGSKIVRFKVDSEPRPVQIHVDEFPKQMQRLVNPNQDIDHIIVVGHSYGAWLTMKLLEKRARRCIVDLITVDAISRRDCRLTGPWKGCKRFPSDIDQGALKVRNWAHFFQREDFWLQSDEAHLAGRNYWIKGVDHSEIKYSPFVIEKIKKTIESLMIDGQLSD